MGKTSVERREKSSFEVRDRAGKEKVDGFDQLAKIVSRISYLVSRISYLVSRISYLCPKQKRRPEGRRFLILTNLISSLHRSRCRELSPKYLSVL